MIICSIKRKEKNQYKENKKGWTKTNKNYKEYQQNVTYFDTQNKKHEQNKNVKQNQP